MARPSTYTDKIATRILRLYASGKTLQTIEKEKGVPTRYTIIKWRKQYPEFGRLYDIALLSYSEAIIEEALQIADTEDDAKKAKNRIDIRTWIASKYNRARFGDKIDIDIKATVDISPALALAVERMRAIGTGQDKLIEADVTE